MTDKNMMPGDAWYYVGDLCYVMHDVWSEVCELMFPVGSIRAKEGIFTLKDGRQFAIFGTAYGDGTYFDEDGDSYPVDSGTIGCIKKDDIVEGHDNDKELGNVQHFAFDFIVEKNAGIIRFGRTHIDTVGDSDYDME